MCPEDKGAVVVLTVSCWDEKVEDTVFSVWTAEIKLRQIHLNQDREKYNLQVNWEYTEGSETIMKIWDSTFYLNLETEQSNIYFIKSYFICIFYKLYTHAKAWFDWPRKNYPNGDKKG